MECGLVLDSRGRWLSAKEGLCLVSVVQPSEPGGLKSLKELVAHLMRSGFKILAMLLSSRFSTM